MHSSAYIFNVSTHYSELCITFFSLFLLTYRTILYETFHRGIVDCFILLPLFKRLIRSSILLTKSLCMILKGNFIVEPSNWM
jgi:hypothetical protein